MFKKIIWALLELSTIGYGTYSFVTTMTNEDYVDHEVAGISAFLIVFGLLLRNWRMTLFVKEGKNEKDKADPQTKTGNVLLIVVISLVLFILNKKVNDVSWISSNNESEIQDLESKLNEFDNVDYRLESLETLEERIEHLERYSHWH